jgi:hypothetical protein
MVTRSITPVRGRHFAARDIGVITAKQRRRAIGDVVSRLEWTAVIGTPTLLSGRLRHARAGVLQ